MRKLIYSMGVSLDGFTAGPGGDIGWSAPDEELHRFHNDQAREAGAHLRLVSDGAAEEVAARRDAHVRISRRLSSLLVQQTDALGTEFARALAAKDARAMLDLMHPEIDFRGMTPKRTWEAGDPETVMSVLLGHWFEDADEIEALERLETDAFADRQRVGYRFRVRNPDGRFVVEQQAYLSARDGRIGWMRVVCSGFRPAPPECPSADGR